MTRCRGLVLAAPASSCGKTTIALGLLRMLARKGARVQPAKSGPDYIDTGFLAAAGRRPALNLDAWAMTGSELLHLAGGAGQVAGGADTLIAEGAMGVLDGAGPGRAGSAASLAEHLGVPVVLVLDVSGQADSAILPVLGLRSALPSLELAGVILNCLASRRHEQLVRAAMDRSGIRVLGGLAKSAGLTLPSRHLGLVPAAEHPHIEELMESTADAVEDGVDVGALLAAAAPIRMPEGQPVTPPSIPPLGQRISIARDQAFAFVYEHVLQEWSQQGAGLSFFSPLAGESPADDCDAVFLPGGYPELHAEALSNAEGFRCGMQAAAARQAVIYGECGGYMVLGKTLADRDGQRFPMLGLLPHATTFARPKLHLGYRLLRAERGAPLQGSFAGHEFHYSSHDGDGTGRPMFTARDADGNSLGGTGQFIGSVGGSYVHLICRDRRHHR